MPTLAIDNFNIVCATLGGFITLFGLVSYLMKEKFYLSEARKFKKVSATSDSHTEVTPSKIVINSPNFSDITYRWSNLLTAWHKLDQTG